MLWLYLSIAINAVLLIICMTALKNYLLSPQFGVILGFFLSEIVALIYAKKWELSLDLMTFTVLSIGMVTITTVSIFFQSLFRIRSRINYVSIIDYGKEISIYKRRVIVWTMVQVLVLALVMIFLLRSTGAISLPNAINAYRRAALLTNDAVPLPRLLKWVRSICIYSGYLFAYLWIHSLVYRYNKNMRLLFLSNVVLASLNTVIVGGSRGGVFQYVIATVTIWFTIFSFKNNKSFTTKQIVRTVVIAGLLTLSMGEMRNLLGRGKTDNLFDYIATYLAGGIYNLNKYITELYDKLDQYHNYTFIYLNNYLYKITGHYDLIYVSEYSNIYNTANGYSVGNVYTMFSAYYHDGKLMGVFVYSALMAFIGQLMLYFMLKKHKRGRINIYMVLYAYIYFNFLQSFFANRFYTQFFDDTFLKMAFFLVLLNNYFSSETIGLRIRINKHGANIEDNRLSP